MFPSFTYLLIFFRRPLRPFDESHVEYLFGTHYTAGVKSNVTFLQFPLIEWTRGFHRHTLKTHHIYDQIVKNEREKSII